MWYNIYDILLYLRGILFFDAIVGIGVLVESKGVLFFIILNEIRKLIFYVLIKSSFSKCFF